jgi:hypothetical protein
MNCVRRHCDVSVYNWQSTVQWGGFAVDNPTLTRFFSLHVLINYLNYSAATIQLIKSTAESLS